MSKDDLFDDTCGGCVHYMEREGEQSGSCYRYPPTPLPISMQPQGRVIAERGGEPGGLAPIIGEVMMMFYGAH